MQNHDNNPVFPLEQESQHTIVAYTSGWAPKGDGRLFIMPPATRYIFGNNTLPTFYEVKVTGFVTYNKGTNTVSSVEELNTFISDQTEEKWFPVCDPERLAHLQSETDGSHPFAAFAITGDMSKHYLLEVPMDVRLKIFSSWKQSLEETGRVASSTGQKNRVGTLDWPSKYDPDSKRGPLTWGIHPDTAPTNFTECNTPPLDGVVNPPKWPDAPYTPVPLEPLPDTATDSVQSAPTLGVDGAFPEQNVGSMVIANGPSRPIGEPIYKKGKTQAWYIPEGDIELSAPRINNVTKDELRPLQNGTGISGNKDHWKPFMHPLYVSQISGYLFVRNNVDGHPSESRFARLIPPEACEKNIKSYREELTDLSGFSEIERDYITKILQWTPPNPSKFKPGDDWEQLNKEALNQLTDLLDIIKDTLTSSKRKQDNTTQANSSKGKRMTNVQNTPSSMPEMDNTGSYHDEKNDIKVFVNNDNPFLPSSHQMSIHIGVKDGQKLVFNHLEDGSLKVDIHEFD